MLKHEWLIPLVHSAVTETRRRFALVGLLMITWLFEIGLTLVMGVK